MALCASYLPWHKKSDPVLLVFAGDMTCHAYKDPAGRSWQDHKMAIMGGFLRKSWSAGDCSPPRPPLPKQTAALKTSPGNQQEVRNSCYACRRMHLNIPASLFTLAQADNGNMSLWKSKRDMREVLLLQCRLPDRPLCTKAGQCHTVCKTELRQWYPATGITHLYIK